MAELRDITAGATVAAKAFGIEAEVAALDIEQALAGNLTKEERFSRALREPMDSASGYGCHAQMSTAAWRLPARNFVT